MPAFTSIALGAATAASGIGKLVAGRKRKKAAGEQQRVLDRMNKGNESDFLRDYYQDAFDDPSSRSYMKRISEDLYDRSKSIENSGIATGATHENMQARKGAANGVMSDAVNNVVVNHEARKRAAKEQYVGRKGAIASGDLALTGEKGEIGARNWEAGMDTLSGLASLAGQVGAPYFGRRPAASSGTASLLDGLTAGNKQWAADWTQGNRERAMKNLENWNG